MNPTPHYFKKHPLTARQLTIFSDRAKGQAECILHIFRERGPVLTPWEVHDLWAYQIGTQRPLITSVRRSMTVLTGRGKLRKRTDMKMGPYGAPEFYWELVKDEA
jgi:hypothetical protein